MAKKSLPAKEQSALLGILEKRFRQHMERHKGIAWNAVQSRLEAHPDKLWSLNEMERTGGEPDLIGQEPGDGAFIFCDCSAESPAGRRSLCYDREALDARKENKPAGSACELAAAMGIELLSEAQYRNLQALGKFDAKTSSWVQTPAAIRKLDGALFCDYRYGTVFLYHNGAQSYYAARGFRGLLKI